VTGATIWVPESTPSSPLVDGPDGPVVPLPVPPLAVPDPVVAVLSPRTEIALPPTVTGAVARRVDGG
ncbi:hypothetical protein, partial [Microbacterium sp. 8M]|uniref:hypothetical protein n=1 Tax=Microbacterium sp. 8M TaxID=2653153 RepID=UPI001F41879E